MFCDNCGSAVDDDAVFCAKCGNQLSPQVAPKGVPTPPRRSYARRSRTDDNLCFGEDKEQNPYTSGIVFIFIAIFLFVIFFLPDVDVTILIVLAFLGIGALIIANALRQGR
ncbi:MAG: zinc-ribbon domain-containing protein [Candidatus Kariarchaeaceae archaeon]|jgi:uncharacterized membrane protein YvbJ